ncbi:FAD-dependent oxidoreductase [Arthrobacter sp. MI7-26]|uniref:FAD-dependent oxidoreductase n=1 Tax=Arthrobacter sp. MI7-26 TaxID=2993653 RepID=UPI002248894A|nr:FAD-dependent oxidoreductase [Arthrobacter sp. MI7-26]MCX2746300.1 FAD-dependent oxidoreductase [Arthrobacter sp. MI7-26]
MERAQPVRDGHPRIAIVGSGPSGCYTAQFLRKRWAESDIVIFDRLDTPYGLIRYGVAPDHLGTKAIAKQFERLFAREGVQFVGGVDVGRDISIEDLRADFDVVVLATGLWADRTIDGFHRAGGHATHAGVYGSGELTRMINGHPDRDSARISIGRRPVIVGNGNVAIDLVRLMLTSPAELAELGVPHDSIEAVSNGPVEHIDVVGRSGVAYAKFDPAMVRELGKLSDVRFTTDIDLTETGDEKTSSITDLVDGSPAVAGREVRFHFGWTPSHLEGEDHVDRAVFRDTAGRREQLVLETDSVCTAVGFTEAADDVLLRSTLESETTDLTRGLLGNGIYCVGWFRRGPVGTIPANRSDARTVADAIIADIEAGHLSGATPRP